jgi:outer membrane protein
MNKITTFIFVICSLIINAGISKADEQKVGVVDMQKCIQTSDAGKKARNELESAVKKKEKEIKEMEGSFEKAQEEFSKKRSALSESAKAEQGGKLQEKYMKLQEAKQKAQMELHKREQEMSAPIISRIRDKVADIAKKRGFSLVLEKNENIVMFSEDKVDITEEVLKSLN